MLNFMQNKDQFLRETSARKSHQLESKFVVGISKAYDGDVDPTFLKAVCDRTDLAGYKYAIVMPCADRNMDTIFRSEQPRLERGPLPRHSKWPSPSNICTSTGIVHGDIKFNMESDETLPKFYAASKFSSAVLPPEFVHPLKNDAEVDQFRVDFRGGGW